MTANDVELGIQHTHEEDDQSCCLNDGDNADDWCLVLLYQ